MARTLRLLIAIVSSAVLLFTASGAAAAPPYVYALQQVGGHANQIFGFRLDPLTGALTALPGFPVATGGNGSTIEASEQLVYGGGRLFAVNDASDTLSVFTVNHATGALTPLPFSPVAIGSGIWSGMSIHPTGSPVLVGNVAGSLASFVITSTTATPAAGSPFAMLGGANPVSITFSRDGNYAYAGGNGGNRIAGFSVGASTGVLTALPGSPFDSSNALPSAYATDNAGRLFMANSFGAQLRAFTTAAGVLTGVTRNPFPSGATSQATRGVVHPAGFYMTAHDRDRQLGVYRITGAGAETRLTPVAGSPFFRGVNTLALTPDGSLLVGGHRIGRNLEVLQVNPATGALTLLVFQPSNTLGTFGIVAGLALVPARTIGDVDADRNGDLLWRNKVSGQNIGWLMNGAAVSNSAFLSTIANTNWEVKGTGDFNADGRADVIWRNRMTGQNIAWLMNGLTVSLSAFLPTITDINWEIRGVGDLNADDKADVIWRNQVTGQNIVWLMNGTSVASSAFLLPMPDTNLEIVGVGDVDGNGKADVIWRNTVTGQNSAWLMNGAAVAFVAGLPTIANTNWEVKGVADLDGDGKADVLWRNEVSGQNIGWLMNGTTVASSAFLTTIPDVNWEIKALRDVDGDSHADVIWRNTVTGQNAVWLMNGFAIKSATNLPTIANVDWEIVGR